MLQKLHVRRTLTPNTNFRNLSFLHGKIDVNPGHLGPLDEETAPILHGLIELHEYGILTCGSQPFEKSSTFLVGKGWYQKRQRPYVHFLLPTLHRKISIDCVDAFIERLFADKSILVSVHSECDEYGGPGDSMRSKLVTPQTTGRSRSTYQFRTNAHWNKETVTIDRLAKTSRGLLTKAWEECSFFPYTSIDFLSPYTSLSGSANDNRAFEATIVMKPLAIGVMARKWGAKLDLQDILQQHCEEAGIRRVFPWGAIFALDALNAENQWWNLFSDDQDA